MSFVELSATSNFTFLTGGSHPEEYIDRAGLLGLSALAIADENSVAGIVRAHSHARELRRCVALRQAADADPIGPPAPPHLPVLRGADIHTVPRLIPAARIVTDRGFVATMIPRDRAAWGRLSRLLTLGRTRATKGKCAIRFEDVLEWGEGAEFLLHPTPDLPGSIGQGDWQGWAARLVRRFPDQVSVLMAPRYDGQDRMWLAELGQLAARLGVPTVASALPLMHHGARRKLTDVLTAIRLGRKVDALGRAP